MIPGKNRGNGQYPQGSRQPGRGFHESVPLITGLHPVNGQAGYIPAGRTREFSWGVKGPILL